MSQTATEISPRAIAELTMPDLATLTDAPVERLPEPESRTVEGVALPVLRLNGFEVSAVEKVATALARL